MLYTAITRARVNIFIAETDTESSRPMFNYFQKRCVVDVMSKENEEEEGLSGVRVFGAMNTVEDWRNRGEYYIRNAEGERQVGWWVAMMNYSVYPRLLKIITVFFSNNISSSQ